MKLIRIVILTLFVAVAITFLMSPTAYMQSFLNGITVWAYNVLPALFPFAVMSALAAKFLPIGKYSACKALFGVQSDNIYAVSLLCGYPVGAKMIAESNFDSNTATQMCSFCSSASPIFIVATVGTKLLANTSATVILIVAHIASTILNGLIFRTERPNCSIKQQQFAAKDFGETITSSVLSVLSVGGLVALFYMLTDIFRNYLPMPLADSLITNFLFGLLEMTNGIVALCKTCNTITATVLSSFLLAFGGMCVLAQSMAFLTNKHVKTSKFLLMKFSQASIATVISFVLCKLFL